MPVKEYVDMGTQIPHTLYHNYLHNLVEVMCSMFLNVQLSYIRLACAQYKLYQTFMF